MPDAGTTTLIHTKQTNKQTQDINPAQMQTTVCLLSAPPPHGAFGLLWIRSEAVMETQAGSQSGTHRA